MANDKKWARAMIDRLLQEYSKDDSYLRDYDTEYQRMLANYQLYNNQINQADFERECNPFGIDVGQFKDEIKPYNKAPNKINVILGEEFKRPINFRTVLINTDGIRAKEEVKKQMLQQFFRFKIEKIIENYNTNFQTDLSTEDLIKPEELDRYMKYTYRDAKEEAANKLMQYLIRKEMIKDKMNDAYKHGLLSGYEFVWVGVRNNEVSVEPLNSLGVFYHKSPEVKYIQDGLYAGYRTFMNVGDILDLFGESMDPKDVERLENSLGVLPGDNGPSKQMKYNFESPIDRFFSNMYDQSYSEGSYGKPRGEDWLVAHVEWVSQKKVGFISFIDEYGEEQTDMVSEDFKVPEEAVKSTVDGKTTYSWDQFTFQWKWIPEVWEGVRIGDDIYVDIGPKKYQYRSIDNPWSVKLGYHGVCYSAMNADPISLMDRMKPFQYLYFIVAHKLKQLIARDRGQVYHFDLSMVPSEIGLEKTLYYLDQMDIDLFDPLKNAENPGAAQRGKITGATNRSNMQHIMNYVQLMAALDDQIGDVAGVNRAREGQISTREAVTNSQVNIQQSSTITEAIYFKPHEIVWQEIFNSMLQCAQTLFAGKKMIKQFVLDDMSVEVLKLGPDDLNADFGIFVSNASKDVEVYNNLQALAQPLIQNDKAKFSDIISLFKGTSINELEKDIKESEQRLQQEQLQQIRAQQETQQQQIQAQQQEKEAERMFEMQLQAQKDDAAMQRELVKLQAKINDLPDDTFEQQKFKEELQLEYDKLAQEKELTKLELNSKEKIAKQKPANSTSQKK